MGFNFTIEYKSGASNRVADALSRRDVDLPGDDPSILALLSQPVSAIMQRIRDENKTFPDLIELHRAVAARTTPLHVSVADGILFFKHRVYLSRDSNVRLDILAESHDAKMAGHPGEKRTFARVSASFFWQGMRDDIHRYVAACAVCQATKYITDRPSGLIQPLPIPDKVWAAASMDFIVGLPPSYGYTAIMVVVDRLSKYAHFGALPTGFDALKVAKLFVSTVVKLHGFPEKLLTDRETIFVSDFWKELLTMSGTKLQFTTAYHPQTDGQSEVTNRSLEQYLRAFTFEQPRKWFEFLPWAELAMNCSVNTSIGMSPFKALYGRDPPNIFGTPAVPAKNAAVAENLGERTELLQLLKRNLALAQKRMVHTANQHRRHVEFQVGERVLLRLQPYRQVSVGRPASAKLSRRYYGPYEILERIGAVAYRLQLPVGSRIHEVFHVSLLKPFVPPLSESITTQLPTTFKNGRPIDVPIRATAERTALHEGLPQQQWLVYWSSDPAAPTWAPKLELLKHFPSLSLVDTAVLNQGGVDRDLNNQTQRLQVDVQDVNNTNNANVPDTDHEEEPPSERGRSRSVTRSKKDRPRRNTSRPAKFKDYTSY